MEIVELCKKYRHAGVVAIDLAGDELLCGEANLDHRRAYEVSGPWFWFWWAQLSQEGSCFKNVDGLGLGLGLVRVGLGFRV